LTQTDLARILGFLSESPVSRHERSKGCPDLSALIGYEIVFGQPLSELFPRAYEEIATVIETRLSALEGQLHQSDAKGRVAAQIARKLEFLCQRKDVEMLQPGS
jgi:hypothetical protein